MKKLNVLGLVQMQAAMEELQVYLATKSAQVLVEKIGLEAVISLQVVGMRVGARVTDTPITYEEEAARRVDENAAMVSQLMDSFEKFNNKKDSKIKWWKDLWQKVTNYINGKIDSHREDVTRAEGHLKTTKERFNTDTTKVSGLLEFFGADS